jgi:RNA polymerase sigma-70 factor, ECF subfamily
MLEDRVLLWRLKRGDGEALRRIYEKYRVCLMSLATGLLGSREAAEDVLHDVFVNFAAKAVKLEIAGELRSYLATSIVNKVRDKLKKRSSSEVGLTAAGDVAGDAPGVVETVARAEEIAMLREAMKTLPREQREVLMLRVHGRMRFEEIAKVQGTISGTARARYRYGLEKLRSLMNGEVARCER